MAMAAATGMKQEDATNLFNTFLKNSGGILPPGGPLAGMPGLAGGMPGLGGLGPLGVPLQGPSSSVPPAGADEVASIGGSAKIRNSNSHRPRSGSPRNNASATPNAKRPKVEAGAEEDGDADGELEIDVQNDDAGSSASAAPSASHTNGTTSHPGSTSRPQKDGRESAQSASSRDSATPRSGKHGNNALASAMNPLLAPGADVNALLSLGAARGFPFDTRFGMFAGLGMPTNGKPSYAYKLVDGQPQPVNFPGDASTGPDIPK